MTRTRTLAACLAWVFLAGLGPGPAPTVHDSMVDVVAPASTALWDVALRAMGDDGATDASRLTDADWASLAVEAQRMKDVSAALAAEPRAVAAAPSVKLQDEGANGGSSAQDVQGFIDADPAAFAGHWRKLAEVADGFAAAARTKDGALLTQASDSMEGVCSACHTAFWYPKPVAAN